MCKWNSKNKLLDHSQECDISATLQLNFLRNLKCFNNEICHRGYYSQTTKMKGKQGWKAIAFFFVVMFCFGMCWFLHMEYYMQRSYPSVHKICIPGDAASKAEILISNYSRDHPVFLQLSDYFWVKNQSIYRLPYGTNGSEELLMKFLALTNRYHVPEEIKRLPCRRCVVVGNGHHLKNSSLGETINKYDVVIRLNNAPVHKYEKDVGSKTTMRLFYPESADFDPQLDNNPDTLLVLVPFKQLDIQWMKIILNNEKRVRKGFWKMPPIIWEVEPENIRILNPYYMAVTATQILKSKKMTPKPTTGMLAITFALHFCDTVHIAGFGYPALTNKKQPIHYYEKVTLKSMAVSGHNITLEAQAIKSLLQQRIISNLTYF
ncbi:ST3 beta-galactoside alpha-2,3-sialyltransferase 4 L homeolog isoform X2 [Xenopus laevis]|uniref:CMP-N-acetylneuraminate-beta-galactosamide-alpha-2,3-sialyltransferase 4 n=1 Tax=Xenopus laevis TaxID=8355 RepID=A0A8J0T8Q0_XENLA|nr:ST3 beta-galactoside alpha-2,3-sialyltransferase 4 L homeolog isoform X2 [Xenopus laevis]